MSTQSVLEGKRILIVDDEPDVLESLEELLNMSTTVRAQTFEEANAPNEQSNSAKQIDVKVFMFNRERLEGRYLMLGFKRRFKIN